MMEEKTETFCLSLERDASWSWPPTADLVSEGTNQNPANRQKKASFKHY